MTEKEAQYECTMKNAKPATDFCPLINGVCRMDCTCYVKFRVDRLASKAGYYVVGGYCGNAMFSGERNTNVHY